MAAGALVQQAGKGQRFLGPALAAVVVRRAVKVDGAVEGRRRKPLELFGRVDVAVFGVMAAAAAACFCLVAAAEMRFLEKNKKNYINK
jgi:hypothetical protein